MQDLKAFTNIIEELKELNGETLKLPLPRRSEFKPVIELKKMHFGKFWDKVVQVAGMELSTPEMLEILFRIPGFETQMSQIGIHHASLTSQLLSIRHFAKKAPIMTITQALVDLLNDTGIKDDVPCKYFAPPNRTVYIEFNAAEARNLAIHRLRSEGIEYLCEGCYVQERILDHAPRMSSAAREALEIDPHKRTRIIEVGFTASPYGNEAFLKSNAIPVTCDLIDFATIYIQDENEPLAEMLQKHLIFSRSIAAETGSLSAQHLEDFEKRFTEGFSQLAKILFYLHVERRERIEVNEQSLIEERLKKTAPKKHGKLKRQLNRVYDHIVIGPQHYVPIANRINTGDLVKGTKSPHFRRGHFAVRWKGTGQAKEPVMTRVKESLVNEHLLNESKEKPTSKSYIVK